MSAWGFYRRRMHLFLGGRRFWLRLQNVFVARLTYRWLLHGVFENPLTADKSIQDGQIDLAMIGRVHLANPNWSYQAAQALKIENSAWVLPAPYAHWLSRYKLGQ